MTHQDEHKASWLWPLTWSPVDAMKNLARSKGVVSLSEEEADRRDRERAFEIADSVEQGLARETVTEFVHPLRRASALWRFYVERSEDRLEYRLFTDGGAFLMYAKAYPDESKVHFHVYNPCQRSDTRETLFDAARPDFLMTYNGQATEWRVVQERCEYCQLSPSHFSCTCHGKQQVAVIRHAREPVGGGIVNCMSVHVPGRYSDGSRVVWCPLVGLGDLADTAAGDGYDYAEHLVTRHPTWNNEVNSLVLDFEGRDVISSAKNFQLAGRGGDVVCQYGKIAPDTFSLDFKFPLSVIQAFSASLSTLQWS